MIGGSSKRWMALLAVVFPVGCSGPSSVVVFPPDGYRAIAESEYSAGWRMFADLFPTPDRADGDFDGDGELDQAHLWIHETGEKWVLMAYLSSVADTAITVYESERLTELRRRPIRAIPPGDHKTWRYYGHRGIPDTTTILHLSHDAINLARTESEGFTYVWNPDKRSFDAIYLY
jgi:hypothetical protein